MDCVELSIMVVGADIVMPTQAMAKMTMMIIRAIINLTGSLDLLSLDALFMNFLFYVCLKIRCKLNFQAYQIDTTDIVSINQVSN